MEDNERACRFPAQLEDLQFAAIGIWYTPLQTLSLHGFANRTLRGAFGDALKQVCCPSKMRCSDTCPARDGCAYYLFWEARPVLPSAYGAFSAKGVLIRFPFNGSLVIEPGEQFPMEFVLVGRALDHLPTFEKALDLMASRSGLGTRRVRIAPLRQEVIAGTTDGGRLLPASFRDLSIPGDERLRWALLETPTPLTLEHEEPAQNGIPRRETLLVDITFSALVRYSAFRVCRLYLSHSASDASVPVDVLTAWRRALEEQAAGVRLVSARFQPVEDEYVSPRRREPIPLRGTSGAGFYEGPVGAFMPLLRAVEILQVGKDTSLGWGQVRVSASGPVRISG